MNRKKISAYIAIWLCFAVFTVFADENVLPSENVNGNAVGANDVSASLKNTKNRKIVSAYASGYPGKIGEVESDSKSKTDNASEIVVPQYVSFSLTLYGEVAEIVTGVGNCVGKNELESYSVTRTEKGSIYIEAENYGTANITVPFGETVTFYAKDSDGSNADGDWSVNKDGAAPQEKKSCESITFNRSIWGDIVSWFTDDGGVNTPIPGIYTITASPEDHASPSAAGSMTVVGVKQVSAMTNSKTVMSSTNSPGESETLYVPVGTSFSVKAHRLPSMTQTWPDGCPTFCVGTQSISTTGISSGGKTIETAPTITIDSRVFNLKWNTVKDEVTFTQQKDETHTEDYIGSFIVKVKCGTENDDMEKSINITVCHMDAHMTAYRPTTDGPTYGNPFQQKNVPETKKLNPGVGIRVNGDMESSAKKNDLIEVVLSIPKFLVSTNSSYYLKRENSNIKVWETQSKQNPIFNGSENEVEFNFTAETKTIWVENPNGGSSDLEIVSRANGTDTSLDKIHFYPFSSIVIVLGGENQDPTDPADSNHGVFNLAIQLYQQGYDVHMYNEDEVDEHGCGKAYDEVVNAIKNRGVKNVAIIGYSHGGGSTHDLAEKLNDERASIGSFNIAFTAYIDAIENSSDTDTNPEERRPSKSQYHINCYQKGAFFDNLLPLTLEGTSIPVPNGSSGLDYNIDEKKETCTHYTIDDNSIVLDMIRKELTSKLQP